jgi:hypothetical protein
VRKVKQCCWWQWLITFQAAVWNMHFLNPDCCRLTASSVSLLSKQLLYVSPTCWSDTCNQSSAELKLLIEKTVAYFCSKLHLFSLLLGLSYNSILNFFTGTAIWHPRCGPGPTENGTVLNGSLENGHCTDGESGKEGGRDFDHMSSSAVSEMQASNNENGTLCHSVCSFILIHYWMVLQAFSFTLWLQNNKGDTTE